MKMRSASMVQSHYFLKLCAFGVKPTARLHSRGLGTASLVESSTATEQSSCGFDSGPSSGSFFAGIGLARSPSPLCGSYHCDIVVRHHGLKPCAYQTVWNVRHGKDGKDYLDMCLFQRSSDYATAGCINQVQYAVFQILVARHLGYTPGKFTWMVDNVQIYDRHVDQVKEMLSRESVECRPYIWLNPEKKNFYDFTLDDIKLMDYPRDEIKKKNPQLKFPIGI